MSVISSANNTLFKDSSIVISNVKRRLQSFNILNLLPETDFYRWIADVLTQLGIGAMKDSDAFVYIEGSKGRLPYNFKTLYAAYKTTPFFSHAPIEHIQSNSFVMSREVTQEIFSTLNRCNVSCCENDAKIVEKITVKNAIVEGNPLNLSSPILLTLSPNVKKSFIEQDCHNLNSGSVYEITLDGEFIYTNFDSDFIYLQYYGFPIDKDTGLPMIPDITSIKTAIEWDLVYNSFLTLYLNGEVADIKEKLQIVTQEKDYWFAQALSEVKTPSFQTMIESARLKRRSLDAYQI